MNFDYRDLISENAVLKNCNSVTEKYLPLFYFDHFFPLCQHSRMCKLKCLKFSLFSHNCIWSCSKRTKKTQGVNNSVHSTSLSIHMNSLWFCKSSVNQVKCACMHLILNCFQLESYNAYSIIEYTNRKKICEQSYVALMSFNRYQFVQQLFYLPGEYVKKISDL